MHPMLTIAARAADEAGKIIRDGQRQIDRIALQEKSPGDFVSQIDIHAEHIIKSIILDKFPDHAILAEESGFFTKSKEKNNEHIWIIDPLDGTANYLHGIDQYAISIAYVHKNITEVALVYNPATEERFCAARGQGAQLNNRRIRVSNTGDYSQMIIATGFPFKKPQYMPQHMDFLQQVLEEFPDIRRQGSAALDLCSVACGRLNGYFEIGLHSWDVAAGGLIVQESGGIVSSMRERESYINSGNIIAAPAHVHQILKKICKLKEQ